MGDDASAYTIRHPLLVRLLLFLCGMGVFARAEAFFLQTQVHHRYVMMTSSQTRLQLFNQCLGYGLNYYAVSNALMFLPGIIMMIIQGHFDLSYDRRFGTLKSNFVRITTTTLRKLHRCVDLMSS